MRSLQLMKLLGYLVNSARLIACPSKMQLMVHLGPGCEVAQLQAELLWLNSLPQQWCRMLCAVKAAHGSM